MGKRKRKKTSSPHEKDSLSTGSDSTTSTNADMSETTEETVTLPYFLKKMKAVQRKLDKSYKTESVIEIKGSVSNPQIVISLDTARYELLKEMLPKHISSCNLKLHVKNQSDKSGASVNTVLTVDDLEGVECFTATFYNTTSRILVNRIKNVQIFLKYYSHVIEKIPIPLADAINNSVQEMIKTSINQDVNNQSPNISNQLPNQSPNQGETPTQLKSPMATHGTNTQNQSTCSAFNACSHCTNITGLLTSLLSKIHGLEEANSVILNRLERAENAIHDHLNGELNSFSSWMENHVDSRLECQTKEILESMHQQNKYSAQQSAMECEDNPCSERQNHSPSASEQQHTGTVNPATSRNYSSMLQTQPERIKQQLPPENNKKSTATPPNRNTPKHQTIFKGQNNIVIAIKHDSDLHTHFNQDKVRKTINTEFGPTVIELVNKYGFKTSKPKIMVQLKSREIAQKICENWKKSLFQDSTCRLSIDPQEQKVNTVIAKGIPLDADDAEVIHDIKSNDKDAMIERLYKDGKKLRSFKIKFSSDHFFQESMKAGISLPSINILCHVEAVK